MSPLAHTLPLVLCDVISVVAEFMVRHLLHILYLQCFDRIYTDPGEHDRIYTDPGESMIPASTSPTSTMNSVITRIPVRA
jgi:hypothetical protein